MKREPRNYVFDYPVAADQLSAIGRIVIEAGALESALEWAIWGMLGLNTETGQLFTTRQNLETKVKTLTRVIQKTVKETSARSKAADIMARIRDSSGRRNDVVHSTWPELPQATRIYSLTHKAGNKTIESKPVKADPRTLNQIAIDLRADFDDLMAFLDESPSFKPPYVRKRRTTTQ